MDIVLSVLLSGLPCIGMKRLLISISGPFDGVVLCALPTRAESRVTISMRRAESMSCHCSSRSVADALSNSLDSVIWQLYLYHDIKSLKPI